MYKAFILIQKNKSFDDSDKVYSQTTYIGFLNIFQICMGQYFLTLVVKMVLVLSQLNLASLLWGDK